MQIIIKSRADAEEYILEKNIGVTAVVSISSKVEGPLPFITENHKIIDFLYVDFEDIEKKYDNESILMDDSHALGIKDFINKNKDKIEVLLIHCSAGISRSAAIGAALNLALLGDDYSIWKSGDYIPNLHCYKTMLKAYGIGLSIGEITEKYKITKRTFEYKLAQLKREGINIDLLFT